MPAEHAPIHMDDVAGLAGFGPQLANEIGIAAARYEANVLAVGLGGDRKPVPCCNRARLVLGQSGQGKAQEIHLGLGGAIKKIALVAIEIMGAVQAATAARPGPALDIMACRQRIGAKIHGSLQQIAELDGLIAGHAGDGRLAGEISVGKGVDDRLAEILLIVENIMGHAEMIGHATGVANVLPRAAGAGPGRRIARIVELQRDADDVVSLFLEDCGGDRGIDATGHGDDDPGVFRRLGDVEAVERSVHDGPRNQGFERKRSPI